MKRLITGFVLAGLSLAPLGAGAEEAAQTVGFPTQGRLLVDGEGAVDGTLEVTFTLYGQASGGQPVWQETRSVTFTDGYYDLILGDPSEPDLTQPIPVEVVQPPLFLGVQIGQDPELTPRQRVGVLPFAYAAARADRILGGTIEGVTFEGGQYDLTELVVDGQVIIDGEGRYLGATESLNASFLGGSAAADYATNAWAEVRFIPRSGSTQLTQSLRANQRFEATRLQSTTTVQPPLSVASNQLVSGLNVETVGGRTGEELLLRETFLSGSTENRARNGSFEMVDPSGLPSNFSVAGDPAAGSVTVVTDGVFGTRALQVEDNSTSATLSVRQQVLAEADARAFAGRTFSASVHAVRRAGLLPGSLCLSESEQRRTCVALPAVSDRYTRVTVQHALAADAPGLFVELAPSAGPGETATYRFDGLAVSLGETVPRWTPDLSGRLVAAGTVQGTSLMAGAVTGAKIQPGSLTGGHIAPVSLPGNRLQNGSVHPSKLIQGAGNGIDADRLDGLDSGEFLRSDRSNTTGANVGLNASAVAVGTGSFPGGVPLDIRSDDAQVRLEGTGARTMLEMRRTGETPWNLGVGRSGAGATDFTIGAGSAVPLVIKAGSGQVGIGTHDPGAQLHLAGSLKVTGRLERNCTQEVASGHDWVTASCPSGYKILSGSCETATTGAGTRSMQVNGPVLGPDETVATAWQCGGFGRNKTVVAYCCR